MALGLAFFYAAYLYRGMRLWIMLRGALPFGPSVAASTVYQMCITYIPGGLGNVALPALLQRYGRVPAAMGVKLLVAIRLLDLSIICAFAAAAGLTASLSHEAFRTIAILAGVVAFLGLGALLFPDIVGRAAFAIATRIAAHTPWRGAPWIEDALTVRGPDAFRSSLPGLFHGSLGFAVCRVVAAWLMYQALAVPLTLTQAAYLWSFSSFAGAVPFQPPGGAGILDAANMALLLAIGQAARSAAEVVLAMRVLTVPCDIVVGVGSWLYLRRAGRGGAQGGVP
jgi:uncharacterized membrane protein YbhN (UPF0104 family)